MIQQRQTELDRWDRTQWMYEKPATETAPVHHASKHPRVLKTRFGHS